MFHSECPVLQRTLIIWRTSKGRPPGDQWALKSYHEEELRELETCPEKEKICIVLQLVEVISHRNENKKKCKNLGEQV